MKLIKWLLNTMFPKLKESEPEPGWANMPPEYRGEEE